MFGFVYEDSDIEKYSIEKYLNTNNLISNGLMIASGGCTLFEIAPSFDNLTAVDTNPEQLDLIRSKIELLNTPYLIDYLDQIDMVFDHMFKQIKNNISFEEVFSNDNLINKFGPNAVLNTSDSFIDHFKSVYDSKSKYHNWIFDRDMSSKIRSYTELELNKIKSVNLQCQNMIELVESAESASYDWIQTSNLTDWLGPIEYVNFCKNIQRVLKPGGHLLMRRLLSDNLLINQFPDAEILRDQTNFYKETILWTKP